MTGSGIEVLEKLQGDADLMGVPSAKEGLAEMGLLFGYLEIFGVLDKVRRLFVEKLDGALR